MLTRSLPQRSLHRSGMLASRRITNAQTLSPSIGVNALRAVKPILSMTFCTPTTHTSPPSCGGGTPVKACD